MPALRLRGFKWRRRRRSQCLGERARKVEKIGQSKISQLLPRLIRMLQSPKTSVNNVRCWRLSSSSTRSWKCFGHSFTQRQRPDLSGRFKCHLQEMVCQDIGCGVAAADGHAQRINCYPYILLCLLARQSIKFFLWGRLFAEEEASFVVGDRVSVGEVHIC